MIFNTCCVHHSGTAAPAEPALRIYWQLPNARQLPDDYELEDFTFTLDSLEDAWLWIPYAFTYAPLGHSCTGWSDGATLLTENSEYELADLNVQYDFRGKAFLVLTAQWEAN